MRKKILFVDDELNVLQGLRRMLRVWRDEWEMEFTNSGEEALFILSQTDFDVIVTDIRMPGLSGDVLLERVRKQHPQMVRIVLSGQSDMATIIRSIGLAHQCLSKPCDPELLKSTILRASALREILSNDSLKQLVNQMTTLPSMPALYIEMVNELRQPDVSFNRLGKIIAQDAGMSAKILQLVNSAYFGIRRNITDPVQAVVYLGIDTLEALVFSVSVFQKFRSVAFPGFSIDDLWHHSVEISTYTKTITTIEDADKKLMNEALMAGVLHDAGKLVFAANLPKHYSEAIKLARNKALPLHEVEQDMFSATHAQVGAYLLGLWGHPDPIVEALAFHHNPNNCLGNKFSPLTAVYTANILAHEKESVNPEDSPYKIDLDYLSQFGLVDHLDLWRKKCAEIKFTDY